jgi:putative membrane protein
MAVAAPLRHPCDSGYTSRGRGDTLPFFIRMVANAVAILLIGYLLPQVVSVDGVIAALAAAFVLGLVNAVIRPLFVLLTLPVTVVTLGAFLLVINGLLLWMVTVLVPGFHVNGFLGAVVGSILLSVVSWILTRVVQ